MPTWDYAFVLHNGVWVTDVLGLADATSAVEAGTYIVDAFAGLGRLGFEYCGEVTSALVFKRPASGEVRAQLSAAFAWPVGIGAESTPGVAPTGGSARFRAQLAKLSQAAADDADNADNADVGEREWDEGHVPPPPTDGWRVADLLAPAAPESAAPPDPSPDPWPATPPDPQAPTVVVRPPWFRPEATGGTAAQQRARDTLASVFAAVDAAADSREAMTHEQAEAFRAFLRGVLDEGDHGND